MPCGARLEVVQSTVLREGDVRVSDHVDIEVRVLPVLPPAQLDTLVREELVARGWETEPDGSLSKHFGDAVARMPAGSSTIRLAVEDERAVAISATTTSRITEGDEVARAAVEARAASDGDRKFELAKEAAEAELIKKNVDRLMGVYEELRGEIASAVNATTKRALEQRAREIGSIESSREGRGADGSYELTITVKT